MAGTHFSYLFLNSHTASFAINNFVIYPHLSSVLILHSLYQAWPLTPAYGAIIGYIIGLWSAFAINITLVLADADRSAEEERTQPSTASNSPKTRKSRRKAR